MSRQLLPSGLADVLPPLAAAEFRLVHHFLKNFMAFGYAPVIPPMAEFSSTLLGGQGEATAHHTFQFADPLSGQSLALRADMTGQVARIAGASLADAPRPLRLCYAGYTLRTAAEALKTRRQHTQVGLERFGDIAPRSTAEILAIAVNALTPIGLSGITIDLHFPAVLETLLANIPAAKHTTIRDAVRLKDSAQLRGLGADAIATIVEASGPAEIALKNLAALYNPHITPALDALRAVIAELTAFGVSTNLSVDLLDLSGYGYYTGIGYALYWNQGGIEVGRGGCYRTENGEDAVGFTLYINDLLDKLPTEPAAPIAEISAGTSWDDVLKKQRDGFVTILK